MVFQNPFLATPFLSHPYKTPRCFWVRLFSKWQKGCCSFRHGDIRALCHSSNSRPTPCYHRLTFGPYFPPSTSGRFVCPQTAHVAVDAFPSKSLSICLEAT